MSWLNMSDSFFPRLNLFDDFSLPANWANRLYDISILHFTDFFDRISTWTPCTHTHTHSHSHLTHVSLHTTIWTSRVSKNLDACKFYLTVMISGRLGRRNARVKIVWDRLVHSEDHHHDYSPSSVIQIQSLQSSIYHKQFHLMTDLPHFSPSSFPFDSYILAIPAPITTLKIPKHGSLKQ